MLHEYELAFLNIKQAFDYVHWDYVCQVLEWMGLGCNYINWVKLLYTSLWARVRTEGYVSAETVLQWDMRQECLLSPLSFAITMGPLVCRLRQILHGWGTPIGNIVPLVSLFADNAIIYLRRPDISGPIMLKIMQKLSELLVLWVDSIKSALFSLDQLVDLPSGHLQNSALPWEVDSAKYLCTQIFNREQ
ncbi:hypothetical protein NDU88_002266 [Pleurodeles waltl]|uniref:Reverse transcriptase domain-containing protein n=1 Tax=Pleurodeles waltl TaxID=8319 RepID=A0AAV7PAC4_PLEWA|nr:hypothetical protein NDU88_002266 [Pleurodeles waltl]